MNTGYGLRAFAILVLALLLGAQTAVADEANSELTEQDVRETSVERASEATTESAAEAAKAVVEDSRDELILRLSALKADKPVIVTIAANR